MKIVPTDVAGAFRIELDVRGDSRGRFMRRFCEREFAEAGLETRFVQMNQSVTLGRGSVRGLHFQRPPMAEDKLVGCTLGRAFDVAVDLRRGSPTFLRHAAVELDEATAFYIPKGCAHGFQTLTNETHLIYLHSQFYAPEHEGGLRIDDPRLAIAWPLPFGERSERDQSFALIDDGFAGL